MAHNPIIRTGAVVVVSVAVATAIAIYESPQARQFAEDVRRRVAQALHSLGNEVYPPSQPRYNRPEDADGFLRSGAEPGASDGMDADEESKRRQREELMYWNAVRLEKEQKQTADQGISEKDKPSDFDDFLTQDPSAIEKGTLVYNSGAETHGSLIDGLTQRRAGEACHFHSRDQSAQRSPVTLAASDHMDTSPDLYSASIEQLKPQDTSDMELLAPSPSLPAPGPGTTFSPNESSRSDEIFASIHAWANTTAANSLNNSSDPIHVSASAAAKSSPQPSPIGSPITFANDEFNDHQSLALDSGRATPTDTMSVADSALDMWRSSSNATSDADVVSLLGMSTPGTWTEVGSEIGEQDASIHAAL